MLFALPGLNDTHRGALFLRANLFNALLLIKEGRCVAAVEASPWLVPQQEYHHRPITVLLVTGAGGGDLRIETLGEAAVQWDNNVIDRLLQQRKGFSRAVHHNHTSAPPRVRSG